MAKARAEGRVRLSGYLSLEGSEIVDRLALQSGSRNAAIEMALRLAEAPMSDDALLAALRRRLKGARGVSPTHTVVT